MRKIENKIIVLFRSNSKRNKKFQKKKAKKLKNFCKTIMASFQSKTGWNSLKKRESKNYRSVSFRPDA